MYLRGGGVTGLDRPPNSVKTPTGSSTKLLHNESSTKGGVQQVSGSRIFRLHLCKFCIPENIKREIIRHSKFMISLQSFNTINLLKRVGSKSTFIFFVDTVLAPLLATLDYWLSTVCNFDFIYIAHHS